MTCTLNPHVGDNLMQIVTVYFRNLSVAIAFIFSIQDNPFFIKVRISPSRTVLKQANPASFVFVAWVFVAGMF